MLAELPRITSFLLKIASRCNLACDYCYMYEHADKSWRSQPTLMSDDTRKLLSNRIGEYARAVGLADMLVVFHGGEPLLAGVDRIVDTAELIRDAIPTSTKASFSVQTNGTLLTKEVLDRFGAVGIQVSLSIDGPQWVNDLHRLGPRGESTYRSTSRGLDLLESHGNVYAGLIAVIDPAMPPEQLFGFFAARRPPGINLLLPDANYLRHPPGRDRDPDLYTRWLLNAFDIWFNSYPELPVRIFDAVLGSVAGLPSDTDALGLGDVSLLTIETDGSYHDLDVLKITTAGTSLGSDVWSAPILDAIASPRIAEHRRLLSLEGLSAECRKCPVVHVCGGGSIPHRYAADGFTHPTIYCREMLSLISHARQRMQEAVENDIARSSCAASPLGEIVSADLARWESPETSASLMRQLMDARTEEARHEFSAVLRRIATTDNALYAYVSQLLRAPAAAFSCLAVQPAVHFWTHVMNAAGRGETVHSIDGEIIQPDPTFVQKLAASVEDCTTKYPRLHQDEIWLRLPFGRRIVFEDEETARSGCGLVEAAFEIIENWRPALVYEIRSLNPDVQFIRDTSAHPDKAVSFSDSLVPGALYVGISIRNGLIDPYVVAEALVHEHRHQKLYLLQREMPLLQIDVPLVTSPWRADPRPPSGLLHALFVFVHIHAFWNHFRTRGVSPELRMRATCEQTTIRERIVRALPTLRSTRLTSYGQQLVDLLVQEFEFPQNSAETDGHLCSESCAAN